MKDFRARILQIHQMYLRDEVGTTVPTPASRTFDSHNEMDNGPGNFLPTHVLTVLDVQGRRFPVYWIHYVCWRAMQLRMKRYAEQMARTTNWMEIQGLFRSEEDWLWAIMSLALIQEVEAKMGTRISLFQQILI